MKKSLIVLLSVISMGAQAQTNMNDTIFNLSEVTVKGRSIIQKVDRMLIIPTRDARKNAYNPYDLMFNMAIPRLNVNVIGKELTANGGAVQTRINGIKASQAEVEALLPKDIVRIEFIENPGKRYGDGELGAVIDIIVRKREEGGLINVQTTNSPHVLFGENNLTAKYNRGKSQWGLNYALSYRGVKKDHTDKTEDFLLVGGNIHRVQEGVNDQKKWAIHNIDLSYNYAEPGKYTFYAVFRNNIKRVPHQDETNMINHTLTARQRMQDNSYSPALDLYFQRVLPNEQTITLNLTGTLINSSLMRTYTETDNGVTLAHYLMDVDGSKRSIIGEAIYDKRFKTAMLSAGVRHYQMHDRNEYNGTSPVTSEMNQMRSSAFVEVQGAWRKLNYSVSAGMTRSYFEESDKSHTYYTVTPTLRVSFAPHKNGYLNYRFSTDPQIPSLSALTDVEQAIDTIQISRGNPNLLTYNVYNNTFNYSYSKGKVIAMLNANYSYYDNCIMESVSAEGRHLIIGQDNQKSYQTLQVGPMLVLRGLDFGKLKNFLTLSLEGGFSRYWSYGNNYTHTYSNFYFNAQCMMSYKEFGLASQFSKNRNVLFGETIVKGENQTAILATWTHKRLQIGVGMMFPFTNNYKTGRERVSKIAPYTAWNYTKEVGQMAVIRLNYNFEYGKAYRAAQKRMNNSDTESGILDMGGGTTK